MALQIDLTGDHVLITGAGSGIGEACAQTVAEAGGIPWVNDINAEAAERVAASIPGARAIPGDVASPDWSGNIEELHAIVHGAGYDLPTEVGNTDMAAFERLHRVMLLGPFQLTQTLLPKIRPGGCVLFIASVHALATEPATSAYASAKGGQISMVRTMAQDLGPRGIRVVSVAPGYVDTPLLRKWIDGTEDPAETRAHAECLHPLQRMGRPQDIANLVAFLISPLAEFINGANFVIDGGLTAQLPP